MKMDYIRLLADFAGSQIATGTMALLNDLLSWLLLIVPIVGAICIVYFCVRRGHSDEQEKKSWDGRIKTAVVSTIGGVLGVVIINLIISYYQ